jgi:glutaredoxin
MKKTDLIKNLTVVLFTALVAILLGLQLPNLVKKWNGPFKMGDFSMHVAQQKNKLTLYGTTSCPHCHSAREYLRQSGIPFNDVVIDQSKSGAEAFKQLKERAVPVLVSANRLVVGFDQKAYAELNERVNRN